MNNARKKLAVVKKRRNKPEEIASIPIEKVLDPYPLQKRVSLAKGAPEIAAQWHYEKNCGYGPEDFSFGSGISVWWICDKGPDHVWRQTIAARASTGRGCPFCAGASVSVTNSLASLFPKIAKEWHKEKNTAKPTQVTAGANFQAWWCCKKNHEWKATINNRTSMGSGCPKCFDDRRTVGLKDMPERLKYFDYARNKNIDPMRLHVFTEIWWKCDAAKDHRWKAIFWKDPVKEACPFCRGAKPSSTNNLALKQELVKDFDPKLNPGIRLKDITFGSTIEITWKCHKCARIWTTAAYRRAQTGSGCRSCASKERGKQIALRKRNSGK